MERGTTRTPFTSLAFASTSPTRSRAARRLASWTSFSSALTWAWSLLTRETASAGGTPWYPAVPAVVAGAPPDLAPAYSASDIVKNAARFVGGGGGGRRDMAQAGGSNIEGFASAVSSLAAWLAEKRP